MLAAYRTTVQVYESIIHPETVNTQRPQLAKDFALRVEQLGHEVENYRLTHVRRLGVHRTTFAVLATNRVGPVSRSDAPRRIVVFTEKRNGLH